VPLIVNRMIVSWRTLGLALLLSIIVGISGAGEVPDRMIAMATSRLGDRPVSGDIVIVALDDRTLGQTPGGEFSMTQYGEVVSAIDKAGAKRVFLDFYFDRRESDPDFSKLTEAVRKLGDRAVLAVANGQPVPDIVSQAFQRLPEVMARAGNLDGQVERAVIDLAEAVMLERDVGKIFPAVVTDLDQRGARIQLRDLPVVARIDARNAAPGEAISVRLESAVPDQRRVTFQLVS